MIRLLTFKINITICTEKIKGPSSIYESDIVIPRISLFWCQLDIFFEKSIDGITPDVNDVITMSGLFLRKNAIFKVMDGHVHICMT
jgi:hypothetical protein